MMGALIILLNVAALVVIITLFRRGSWLALLPTLGASVQLIYPGVIGAVMMTVVAGLAVALWLARGGSAELKATGGGWKGFLCMPDVRHADKATEAYNPVSAGGLHVVGTLLGVFGLFIAATGILAGLMIWFDSDLFDVLRAWDKAEDHFDGRFFGGLAVMVSMNLLGLAVLAFGKVQHFMREVLWVQSQQLEVMRQTLPKAPIPKAEEPTTAPVDMPQG